MKILELTSLADQKLIIDNESGYDLVRTPEADFHPMVFGDKTLRFSTIPVAKENDFYIDPKTGVGQAKAVKVRVA